MDIDTIALIGGHPALDFSNSVEGRGSVSLINYLGDYDRLVRWAVRAGVLAPTEGTRLRLQAKRHPLIAARIWRGAMDLRESLTQILHAVATKDAPPKTAIAVLNAAVDRACSNRRLHASNRGAMAWVWSEDDDGLEIVLWSLTLAAADLLTDQDRRARIKICANNPCDWMFLDTSRAGRRRWCRMGVCGNNAKVRRFRARQRNPE